MSGNRNIPPEKKLQAVYEYLQGNGGMTVIARKYGVSYRPFRRWIHKYKAFGESVFIKDDHYASYSTKFKMKVVADYLSGKGSYDDLAVKYKIPSCESVRQWVLKYNNHEELKASGTGGKLIMNSKRKTTFEERVEIVQYCITHGNNYLQTAEKFDISYQQARNYTMKYKAQGPEGLRDNRGKRKNPEEMSEIEKLRAEIKILQAEKESAEMEIAFLKKLDEIERRWG